LAFVEDFVDFVGLEGGVHLLVFIRTIIITFIRNFIRNFITNFISQPKVGDFGAKKKIWKRDLRLKSSSGKGVIVYIRFIKVV
jgi:hypothetical protein